ncbi:prephenate dehydratase [Phycicoccus sp. Root563]|uniref:prephenate dehydratase n=1 Tax=Phycicoccus sp. Root563 TaxID=1736562 RepID=UPI000703346C|nr:prephenate dehydratase [Phycicoccus sp. Root563]KQZ89753.1 prephenate dehydratase [Phycicoccus sp. Root563]
MTETTDAGSRTYAYLGPEGTFTQMALAAWAPSAGAQHRPCGSVDAALALLRAGEVDGAMVPIENSVEGGVSATLDALASGDPLVVVAEVLVPITFVLAARPGMALADVRAVGTHSHAWAQVRGWMDANLPDATYVPTLSTAAAAAGLAGTAGKQAAYQAAVCAPVAASNHGLEVLAEDIGDNAAAVTRFVLVARPGDLPERTGADKTTLVLFQRDDHAGGLLELLEQFAVRGINMSRLESRPTKASMGSYCFSIDIEGHVLDERVGEALLGLKRVCAEVRFLGSYPAAHGTAVRVTPHTTDEAFGEARTWLHSLRA